MSRRMSLHSVCSIPILSLDTNSHHIEIIDTFFSKDEKICSENLFSNHKETSQCFCLDNIYLQYLQNQSHDKKHLLKFHVLGND